MQPVASANLPPAASSRGTPLPLNSGWSVSFTSPFDSPATLTLDSVSPWTQQSSPEHRYFAGSGTYRCTFTLPPGWRANATRVELELGRLWTIGEVSVNGASQGVVWTHPFSVDCTAALRDGENEIAVEVVGNWHNRLVGEARGELPKRTRTNIAVSQRKPWKDLEVIPAGLFGPVQLVPYRP